MPSSWGSTTVIAALGQDGVPAPLVFPEASDTQAFQTYMDQLLVPELRPKDVVVFDNHKPHIARFVVESIERARASVLRLPPYSLDFDRSRSCGRSSRDSFAGSRRGRRTACKRQSVRPWTV